VDLDEFVRGSPVRAFDLKLTLPVPSPGGSYKVPEEKMQTAAKQRAPLPFGPFVLERRIAVGGSAEVFLARPRQGLKPAPQLVIKRLSKARGKSHDFEALSREAELHRAVHHPNVVTVFGAGMVGDEPYLAMEYVPGVDLHRLLRLAACDNRTLSPQVAVYIARSIAEALYAVHSAHDRRGKPLDITHGDVSPSNIYLSLDGDVKLGDFGVARAARAPEEGRRGPESGEVLKGKVGYLAPEQLKGAAIDRRCDIFALGVVLGEMLIGEKVFSGSGPLATMLSNREANIEPLRRVSEQLPAPLYQACTRALETEPSRRFPDARAFAASLGAPSNEAAAKAALADWVAWARDDNLFAQKLERRLRHSSGVGWASTSGGASPAVERATSLVRRAGVVTHAEVTFQTLLELAATGHLALDDEVSLVGAPYRRVDAIPELSRYLMPSTANTTAQLFGPGVPDYTAALRDTPMLDVLARMRNRRESGAMFVARARSEGSEERKDIYIDKGRLIHVAASDREDLFGQYMLRLKLITRADLDLALAQLKSYDGRLGDALVGLALIERSVVSRAVRNFGRDRVAALCGWREGHVQMYRGSAPSNVEVPLDLDLTIVMMMAALQALARGEPLRVESIVPGRRFEEAKTPDERGSAPSSLLDLLDLFDVVGNAPVPVAEATRTLIERGRARDRVVSEREVHAALRVAMALEWVRSQ
jgi:serine/threonine protein kinase